MWTVKSSRRRARTKVSAQCTRHAPEHVLVTDRGTVVAELVPPGQRRTDPGVPAGLARLAERGVARLGAPNDPALYSGLRPLRRKPASVARLLDEERGTR